jgi:hypothetical protein
MTNRYGIDVSQWQDPAAPAGYPWPLLSERASFSIARASYGTRPDARAQAHTQAARLEAMQVGLYHFFCVKQPIVAQLDVFCAVAVKCGIGAGDILPALDVEDDGPNKVGPDWEPLVRQAVDLLSSEFGGAMLYLTQAAWIQMGRPAWMLEHPLWVAHYTNAPKPLSPGDLRPAIWQNRVGPFNPGAPFVAREATRPNAIDHNVAVDALPLATMWPTMPRALPPIGPEQEWSPADLANARLFANLTTGLYERLDLNADKDADFGNGDGT